VHLRDFDAHHFDLKRTAQVDGGPPASRRGRWAACGELVRNTWRGFRPVWQRFGGRIRSSISRRWRTLKPSVAILFLGGGVGIRC
jgi:hypothetical protein